MLRRFSASNKKSDNRYLSDYSSLSPRWPRSALVSELVYSPTYAHIRTCFAHGLWGTGGGGCTSNSIYFCGIPDLPPVWRLQSPPPENSSKLFAHAIFGPVRLNVLSNAFRECGWLVVRRCCGRNSRPITTEIGARWGNIRLSGRPRGRRYGVLAYFPGFACARKKKLDFPSRHEAK